MTESKKIRLYKIIAVVFVVFVLFLTGDGIKNPEINHRSMCIVMGIDGEESGVSASVQIIVPEPQGQGKQMIVTEKGQTLSEALDRINISIGQKVELGHCGLIILGEEFVKKPIFSEMLYLLSSGKTSPDVNLVVAKDIKAKEVLSKLNDLSKIVSEGINNIVAYADTGVHTTRKGVLGFLSESFSAGASSTIPCMELGQDEYAGEGGMGAQGAASSSGAENSSGGSGGSGESGGSGSSEGGKGEGQTVIKSMDKLVMFKDGQKVGITSAEGTRGVVWLNKRAVTGLILLKDVKMADKTVDYLSCKLISKRVKTTARFVDGAPVFTVKIAVKMSIDDKYEIADIVEKDEQVYYAVKDAMKQLIISEISATEKEGKQASCDLLDINEKFNKFCHKEFVEYGDVLDSVRFEYDITVNIL